MAILSQLVRALPLVALTLACLPAVDPPPMTNTDSAPTVTEPVREAPAERRATLRIDAEPSGKKFQGVWLEFEDGSRWVVDYRPRTIWRSFENRVVLFTGHCYEPFGQAISSTHFEVERMNVEDRQRGVAPLFSIGPAEPFTGVFDETTHPEGSKLAGEAERWFRANDGASFHLFGELEQPPTLGETVTILARRVELDMSYTATTGGDRIWIDRIGAREENPPRPRACP